MRRAAAALLAVAALAGCGGQSHARRDAVNAYFDRVDRAEAPLLGSTGQIDLAFRRFSLSANTAAEIRELRFAQTRIATALAAVRRIAPPAEARRLHADLVRVLSLQHQAAHELLWVARYQPRLDAALTPLPAAGRTLAADLAHAGQSTPKGPVPASATGTALGAYAAAFDRYGSSLGGVLATLERLSAPPVLRPPLDAERRTLRRASGLCAEIAAALRKQDFTAANAAIRQLFATTASASGVRVQRESAAAVRGYNARLRRIAALTARMTRERQRLVQTVG